MAINKEDLMNLMQAKADIERISTISSDGKNLLMRIPKDVREFLGIVKGSRLRWLVDKDKKIRIEIFQESK